MAEIRQLSGQEARDSIGALAAVLLDCVRGGASVSFMEALTQEDAEAFFRHVIDEVERGQRILLAAYQGTPRNTGCASASFALSGSELVGTVQIVLSTPPNQPHRADVAKLLVHRCARGQGIGSELMQRVEEVSREAGRMLLTLDTVTGDPAERLYTSLGWTRVGVIPRYALYPDGRWCDTTIFYKWLS